MNPTEAFRPQTPNRPEIMPSKAVGSPDDPRVIQTLEEYLTALRGGQHPDRHALEARHPDIAEALAECLDALEFVHGAAPDLGAAGASLSSAEIQAAAPLGDFRILREIGRGGMGIVYEAEQLSLGRNVALKVLPFAAALDAKHLQRFKNEAQAAAHLHHQNIVPVYGVGCERGVHYYAMQLIDGQTLADLIRQLRALAGLGNAEALATALYAPPLNAPSPREAAADTSPQLTAPSTERPIEDPGFFRSAAQMGVQAAEALEHAHQLGVVHRDIKPGNLLVDGRGNLWITDFGLAQFHSEGNLTMSGDLLGTIRYMSPEQASAQPLDHRTDIYSLGATLYELLTLEPAFGGSDRQELLRQIAQEEPRLPRKVHKAVPEELETIVLKAMEKNAAERYATARELADDLRRYLEDRPIWAKRPTLLHKARKLARRNKGVVRTALLALAVLLATVAVAATLSAVRVTTEQKATLHQLDLTTKAEEQATRRLYRSLVAEARAIRLSRRMGQRFDSLKILAEAANMARGMHLPETDFRELRSETIACLALPDLRVAKEWPGWPTGSWSVDFDSTLDRYARLDRQGAVSIRRVADDVELCRLPGRGPVDGWLRFSPDGQFLALRDWRGGSLLWKLDGPKSVLLLDRKGEDCVFRPDSRQLASTHPDGTLRLFDLPSGRLLKQLRVGPGSCWPAFHPKNQQLALRNTTGVHVYDLDTGKMHADFPRLTSAAWLVWHPDGRTLAMTDGGRIIHLWDVTTRKPIARLEGHKHAGVSIAFNRAGDLLVSTSWDGTLRLWDPYTGQQLFSTQTWVQSLRFSPDDQLLAGGNDDDDNKLRLWQVATSSGYRTLVHDPLLGTGEYHGCATSPKDRLLAVGMKDGVGLWNLSSGNSLTFLPLGPQSVLFEPSGALLTSSARTGLLRWPIQRNPEAPGSLRIGPPQKHPLSGPTGHIAASQDGRVLASAGYRGTTGLPGFRGRVWHQDLPETPIPLPHHEDSRYLDVSPDGRWVATGSHLGTKVKISDARTGDLVHELPVETGSKVGFSPDGRWLATTGGGCRLWAVGSWQEGPHIGGGAFAFSADGKLLAVETGHGVIWLVDPDTGREYARLEDPNQDRAHHLSLSSDGTQLVSTTPDSPSIHVWDLRTIRKQLAELGLDWDLPPYPPVDAKAARPLRAIVDMGNGERRK